MGRVWPMWRGSRGVVRMLKGVRRGRRGKLVTRRLGWLVALAEAFPVLLKSRLAVYQVMDTLTWRLLCRTYFSFPRLLVGLCSRGGGSLWPPP